MKPILRHALLEPYISLNACYESTRGCLPASTYAEENLFRGLACQNKQQLQIFFRPHIMVVDEGAYSDPVHLWESDVSELLDFAICPRVSVHMERITDLTESALPFK